MYTAVGNLIHEINPHPLIICEGLNYASDLTGVKGHPVQLERPGKVVYSMHDYSWFHASNAANDVWWTNLQTWVTGADIDWCYWALNPTHAKGSNPGTREVLYDWGDREPYGLLASDWHEFGNLTVLKLLKSMIHPRTGPGIA